MALQKQDEARIVDAIASGRIGPNPQAPQPPPQQAKPQQAQPQQAPPQQAQPPKPPMGGPQQNTVADQVNKQASPTTEGDKSHDDSIFYNVGGQQYTPKQLQRATNGYGHEVQSRLKREQMDQALGPINQVIAKIVQREMQSDSNMTADQIAKKLEAMTMAGEKNVQLGGNEPSRPSSGGGDFDSAMSKWESDQAISAPPFYKEMMAGRTKDSEMMANMAKNIEQQNQMFQRMMGQNASDQQRMAAANQGVAGAAKEGVQQAQRQSQQAAQQTIKNNITRAAEKAGVPSGEAQNFLAFIGEVGVTMADLQDPRMASRVMQDFSNNLNSPEFARLKDIHSRRQAWQGGSASTPSAVGTAPNGGETTFDKFASAALGKKGLV